MHSLVFWGGVIWLLASACRPTLSAIRAAGSMEITSTACPNVKDPVSCAMTCESALVSNRKMGCVSLNTSCRDKPWESSDFCRESILNLPDNSGLPLRSILSSVSYFWRGGGLKVASFKFSLLLVVCISTISNAERRRCSYPRNPSCRPSPTKHQSLHVFHFGGWPELPLLYKDFYVGENQNPTSKLRSSEALLTTSLPAPR